MRTEDSKDLIKREQEAVNKDDEDNAKKRNDYTNLHLKAFHNIATLAIGEILDLKNIKMKETEKIAIFNLSTFITEIDHQIPHDLKLRMMQQAVVNAYFAVRRIEGASFLFFSNIIGDRLEKLISEHLRIHGGSLKIPHDVKADTETLHIITESFNNVKINNIYNKLSNLKANSKTIVDSLLMNIVLIEFGSTPNDLKFEAVAQLLTDAYYSLRQQKTAQSEQLANQLNGILLESFKINMPDIIGEHDLPPRVKLADVTKVDASEKIKMKK